MDTDKTIGLDATSPLSPEKADGYIEALIAEIARDQEELRQRIKERAIDIVRQWAYDVVRMIRMRIPAVRGLRIAAGTPSWNDGAECTWAFYDRNLIVANSDMEALGLWPSRADYEDDDYPVSGFESVCVVKGVDQKYVHGLLSQLNTPEAETFLNDVEVVAFFSPSDETEFVFNWNDWSPQ